MTENYTFQMNRYISLQEYENTCVLTDFEVYFIKFALFF